MTEVVKRYYSLTSVKELMERVVSVAFDETLDSDLVTFCEGFACCESITEFCRGIFNYFRKFTYVDLDTCNRQVILMPSYVLRERKVNGKALIIMYSKILQHHGIRHTIEFLNFGKNKAYMYVSVYNEEGDDVILHICGKSEFNDKLKNYKQVSLKEFRIDKKTREKEILENQKQIAEEGQRKANAIYATIGDLLTAEEAKWFGRYYINPNKFVYEMTVLELRRMALHIISSKYPDKIPQLVLPAEAMIILTQRSIEKGLSIYP